EAVSNGLTERGDVKAVRVEGDRDKLRLEAPEGLDRAEVGRSLDHDHISRIEERFTDQLERLDSAARDQQLVLRGPTALLTLETSGDHVQRACEAACGRILEGGRFACRRKLVQEFRNSVARERLRIGETTRKRNDIGPA